MKFSSIIKKFLKILSFPFYILFLVSFGLVMKFAPFLLIVNSKKENKVASIIIIITLAVTIGVINFYLPKQIKFSKEKIAEGYLKYNLPKEAEDIYKSLAKANPGNIDLQRNLIIAYQEDYKENLNNKKAIGRLEQISEELTELYKYYMLHAVDDQSDAVSQWAAGYILYQAEKYDDALNIFQSAYKRNPKLKYLNNTIGVIFIEKGNWTEAQEYFQKEIEVNGAKDLAAMNMIRNAIKFKDFKTLNSITKSSFIDIIPFHLKNDIYYLLGDIKNYLLTDLKDNFEKLDIFALIAAIIIGFFWFRYFSSFDIFEKDPLISRLAIFGLGALSIFFVGIWYDFFIYNLGFGLKGNWIDDSIFSILVIGLGEELAKIIPFLLIWRFTKRVNNTYDAILFAGLSGLGFSSVENYSYFASRGDLTFVGRLLTASILHFTLSAILGYHIYKAINNFKATFKKIIKTIKILGRGIGIAVIGHGIYDLVLIGPSSDLAIISFLILVLVLQDLMRIIKKSLSIKELKENKQKDPLHLLPNSFNLYIIYILLLSLVYIEASISYSPLVANSKLPILYIYTIGTVFYISIIVNSENLNLKRFYKIS